MLGAALTIRLARHNNVIFNIKLYPLCSEYILILYTFIGMERVGDSIYVRHVRNYYVDPKI
jgi:hypothetical protein